MVYSKLQIPEIQSLLEELKGYKRISEAYIKDIDESFENKTLRIGVVGKMKAGKSSLVNAVVFGGNVLPTGVAPVTVTLTEITFSEDEKITVEIMSQQDMEDLKASAEYTGKNEILIAKAASAKNTLDGLTAGYERFVGLPPQIVKSADELKEYVDANGKYSGLAKSVKITLNNKNLKGVTIIDTPGFNDPVTSRGETTKDALSKCNVLLFVHNSDGYDTADVRLLTEQVENAGISEIVDVLNQVDMLGSISRWPKELELFIRKRDEIEITTENIKNLLKNSNVTYVSSLMALCGLIPFDDMDEDMKFYYSKFEENFEELCQYADRSKQQEAFVENSNVASIIYEINRLSKDGARYLIEGPLITLRGKLVLIKDTVYMEEETKTAELKLLNADIEVARSSREIFGEFIQSVISNVGISMIDITLNNLISEAKKDIQKMREYEGDCEFSEVHYPETHFGSSGITAGNIANYNTFASNFESKVRDRLNGLLDSFNNACKAEINALISCLSASHHIGLDDMKWLQTKLISECTKSNNQTAIVIVSSRRISNIPEGSQKQWDRLRGKFLDDYNDEAICDTEQGMFASFYNAIEVLSYKKIVMREVNSLREKIEERLNKTPAQREREKKRLESEIENLNVELKQIDGYINRIDDMRKTVENRF